MVQNGAERKTNPKYYFGTVHDKLWKLRKKQKQKRTLKIFWFLLTTSNGLSENTNKHLFQILYNAVNVVHFLKNCVNLGSKDRIM